MTTADPIDHLSAKPTETAPTDLKKPAPPTPADADYRRVEIDFNVAMTHRVAFTQDLAGDHFEAIFQTIPTEDHGAAKILVVIDREVYRTSTAAKTILERLRASERCILVGDQDGGSACVLDGGEGVKNTDQAVTKVLGAINHHDLDRRSYVLAIGGGAVLDVVGFAAATAHRGIRLIRLPTTTLSQADSGVGVKNSINRFGKKNWLGTFAVPWAVINDAGLLGSLPDRDFRCGFSEAVKVALLKSEIDFDHLCRHAKVIGDREMSVAFDAIERSCRWHLKHITGGGDPFESLQARPLDFGHWSAHKMESLSNYDIRHGEAVAIGVALDCIYSSMIHGLAEDQMMATCRCLGRLGLQLWHETLDDPKSLLEGLEEFRQHLGGQLTLTMLAGVGRPIEVHRVEHDAMIEAIDRLKHIATQVAEELS